MFFPGEPSEFVFLPEASGFGSPTPFVCMLPDEEVPLDAPSLAPEEVSVSVLSTWLRPDPYDLGELSDWLFRDELRWSPSPQQFNGFSRNCHCFDELRAFAYRVVLEVKLGNGTFHQFEKVLLREANEINCRFDTAMHLSEVVAIVRSISKWVWRKFDPASFSRLQSFRGQKGMRSRWKDCVVASQTKPWLAVGISRATYYRHRAKEKGDSF